jgi:hypothetical protein
MEKSVFFFTMVVTAFFSLRSSYTFKTSTRSSMKGHNGQSSAGEGERKQNQAVFGKPSAFPFSWFLHHSSLRWIL